MTILEILDDAIKNKTTGFFKEFLRDKLLYKYEAIKKIDFDPKDPIVEYETYMVNAAITSGFTTAIEDRCASCIETLYKEFCVKN